MKATPCQVCGGIIEAQHGPVRHFCNNEACRDGYVDLRYRQGVVRDNGHLLWQGWSRDGVPALAVRARSGPSQTYYLRKFVYEKYVHPLEKGSRIRAACGVQLCLDPAHLAVRARREPKKSEVTPYLPLRPLLDFAEMRGVPLKGDDDGRLDHHINNARARGGWITVYAADEICIRLLNTHPYFVFGSEFFEVGMEVSE